MTSTTPEDRAELRRLHQLCRLPQDGHPCECGQCVQCEEDWPCPTIRLLDENKEVRGLLERARDKVRHQDEDACKAVRIGTCLRCSIDAFLGGQG